MSWSALRPSASSKDRWCAKNDKMYRASDSQGRDHQWLHDTRKGHGWRWCKITVDDCKAACVGAGDCAEIYYSQSGCCFPSKAHCVGGQRPGGQGASSGKYVLQAALALSPPPPDGASTLNVVQVPVPVSPATSAGGSRWLLLLVLIVLAGVTPPGRRQLRRLLGGGRRHEYTRLPLREGDESTRPRRPSTRVHGGSMPVFDFTTNSFVG